MTPLIDENGLKCQAAQDAAALEKEIERLRTAPAIVQSPVSPPVLATNKPWESCCISRAQWFRLQSAGRTPAPIRLGSRRPVYLIAELLSWLRAGAPPRDQWAKLRKVDS